MKKLIVKTTTSSYPVFIGSNVLGYLNEMIKGKNIHRNVFVIADGNVLRLYRKKIETSIRKNFSKICFYSLKPGESSKVQDTIIKMHSAMLKNNFGRDSVVIAIGGGVTGDIAGFAASTFMRGVQLIHVPTTLLADVDSAIGGKTGINFKGNKNIIGTFYQPQMVLVDTGFLNTLPEREINSGLGEIIKYSFLIDQGYYNNVIKILPEIYNRKTRKLEKLIFESIRFKSSVVSADEKENGTRKILNFGHTFAHAFESILNFKIKHGEAVIAGIISALYLSNRMGVLEETKLINYLKIFTKIKLPSSLNRTDKVELYNIMMHDKKNRGGKIHFVLLQDIGIIVTDVEVDKKDVLRAIESAQKFMSQNIPFQ